MNDDDHILTLEQAETAIIQIVRHAGTELVWFANDRADDIVTQRQQEAG